MTEDKIEEIQKELKLLSKKQIELSKAHQQRFFLYRWFQHDPELQAINSEIVHLKRRKLEYIKIIQAAASVPQTETEKDWSKSPFS
jgi:hypothetical protein